LQNAIDLEPHRASAHDLMAFLLPQVGRFDEAKRHAKTAATLEPNNAAYCVRYIFAGKVTTDDQGVVERLEEMSKDKNLQGPDKIRVEYGLGKAMEDVGQYEESVLHYKEANALSFRDQNQNGKPFDPVMHRREIDLLCQTYTKPYLESRRHGGSTSEVPVFIVGMMRSGTTLTEQILSSHPEVHGAGELNYWIQAGPRTFDATQELAKSAADEYIELLERLGPGKKRVCDKMPQNYLSLGPIHVALPNARIIHCRRDPRDTCLSIFTIPFTFHPPFAYSIKNIAFTYRQYQRVMEHWRKVLPADRLLEVDYEDLVANQEEASRRMIAFLGLEWSDSCLQPERNDRVVNTPSRWQVRQPVYGSSVSRSRKFDPWLGKYLEDWNLVDEL
jgi:tetratricopeptide (TPR) repeat protein